MIYRCAKRERDARVVKAGAPLAAREWGLSIVQSRLELRRGSVLSPSAVVCVCGLLLLFFFQQPNGAADTFTATLSFALLRSELFCELKSS